MHSQRIEICKCVYVQIAKLAQGAMFAVGAVEQCTNYGFGSHTESHLACERNIS